jgi:hypothetical protein
MIHPFRVLVRICTDASGWILKIYSASTSINGRQPLLPGVIGKSPAARSAFGRSCFRIDSLSKAALPSTVAILSEEAPTIVAEAFESFFTSFAAATRQTRSTSFRLMVCVSTTPCQFRIFRISQHCQPALEGLKAGMAILADSGAVAQQSKRNATSSSRRRQPWARSGVQCR